MSIKLRIETKNECYELNLRRRISVIMGESGDGKSRLTQLVRYYANNKITDGIVCECNRNKLLVIDSKDTEDFEWLQSCRDGVVIADEDVIFTGGVSKFITKIKPYGIWLVIISRDTLIHKALDCATDSFYLLREHGGVRCNVGLFNISNETFHTDDVITEDEMSGNQFFSLLFNKSVPTMYGKESFSKYDVEELRNKSIIVDLAVFGAYLLTKWNYYLAGVYKIYSFDSFEQFLLQSPVFDNNESVVNRVMNPDNYANKPKYYSWERYYTDTMKHADSKYSKSMLPEYIVTDKQRLVEHLNRCELSWLSTFINKHDNWSSYVENFYLRVLCSKDFNYNRMPISVEYPEKENTIDTAVNSNNKDLNLELTKGGYQRLAEKIAKLGGSHE